MLPMRGYWIETLERNQFVDVVEEWKSGIENASLHAEYPSSLVTIPDPTESTSWMVGAYSH